MWPYSTRLLCKHERKKEITVREKSTRVDKQAAPIELSSISGGTQVAPPDGFFFKRAGEFG